MLTETIGADEALRSVRREALAAGVLALLAAGVYCAYALVRFWTFHSSTYDLVIFDQAVRSYSRLGLPVSIAKGVHNGFGPRFSVLGDHFSPILAVLAPLYRVHDGPRTLLVAQGLLLALTIVPLWAFARRRLGTAGAACVAGVYALGWPVAEAVAFDFHETAFVPLLSMLMLERHDAGRRWQCAAAAGALLLVKEDMGLLVAGFGLYLLTRRGERLPGTAAVAAGLGWTLLATRVLIPAFGGDPAYYWAYGPLGRDLPHAAAQALAHPGEAVGLLTSPHVKVVTMFWLLAPLLAAPLASPITLSVVPPLAARMLAARFPNWWQPHFQYNVALAALLVAAGVDGAVRLGRLGPRPGAAVRTAWPVAALAATLATLPHFAFGRFLTADFYRRDAPARAAAEAVAAVPAGVLVEAANQAGPALSARDRVLLWDDRPRWAPWVVADVGQRTFPFPALRDQRDRVRLLLRSGYTVVLESGGYLVLGRPGTVPDLRATRRGAG